MTAAIKSFMIEQLLRVLSPESISPENIRVNAIEFDRADNLCKSLQPGDLIFTRTPNFLYEIMRTVVGM
jgi:hypothetical protein